MRRDPREILTVVTSLALFIGSTLGAVPARSVSASRQFIVYGIDARLRGALCDLAEEAKKIALTLLNEPDAWKTPIVIDARLAEANLPEVPPAQLNVSQTGFGLKLQLDLRIDHAVSAPAIEREILRSIYPEMIYRARPDTPAGTVFVQPPDWLVDGTLALAPGSDVSAVTQTLGTSVTTGKVMPLQEILRQRPPLLDSPSRALYRAYAAALVSILTEQADGRARLARFVANLPRAGHDPLADLQEHFPAFGDTMEKVQRNWTLAVARFADRDRYRLLNPEETERQLAQVLRVAVREKDERVAAYSLEEFPSFIRNAESAVALRAVVQQLLLLSARANPLYRPILAEYQRIATLLARKKTRHISERLAQVRGAREHIGRRMSEIADYINWFEATQARSGSGAFQEYMRAAELALEREPRRHDPISVYLDALEAQMSE